MAAFARRRDQTWFLGIMNGEVERSIEVPLSFLSRGRYASMLVRDQKDEAAAVKIENSTARRSDQLTIDMRLGGGLVARLTRVG